MNTTVSEIIDYFKILIPVIVGCLGIYKFFSEKNREIIATQKKERQEVEDRLEIIERKQEKNIPLFEKVITEFGSISDHVKNNHELRFTGIVSEIGRLRDSFEQRFVNTERNMDNYNKRIDKLEYKIDKNFDRIMDELMKINK